MAQQEDKDPGTQGENPQTNPLFIQKQQLDQDEQKKLVEHVNSMEKTFRALNEMWETMSNVFSQREEINIARQEAHIRQAKEKQVDSINVAPGKMEGSEDSAITDIDLDELTAKRYYEMWSNDLKRNIEQQRRKTRRSVEKWFRYLHTFDDTEEQLKTSHRSALPWETIIWYGFVIIFCVLHTALFFGPESTDQCQKDPLTSYSEKFLQVFVGAYNFYLSFHNITIDHTGNSSYWMIDSNSSSV